MSNIVIVNAKRTAIGKLNCALRELSAPQLGGIAIKGTLEGINISPKNIDELIMGQVLQAGCGQAPARQAANFAGLPFKVHATVVRKECASSLTAVALAALQIKTGEAKIVIAGGMENMSQAPYMLFDGLQDACLKGRPHMAEIAEKIASRFKIPREEQDIFALSSYERALAAKMDGRFKEEIIAIPQLQNDEGIRETSLEELTRLHPRFKKSGTITAGNASQRSDGAAAMILMTEERSKKLGLEPMAKIIAQATHSVRPQDFPIAPIGAIKKVLRKANLKIEEIGLFEINEAFAVVPLVVMDELGIPLEKVNVRGGAITLGHPLGATGARILTTLICALKEKRERFGIATACHGGGGAVAIPIENLS